MGYYNVQIAEFPSDREIMLFVQEEYKERVEESDGEVDGNNEEKVIYRQHKRRFRH